MTSSLCGDQAADVLRCRAALAAKKQAVRAAARRAQEAAEREVDAQHEANACAELDSSGSEQRAATPPRAKQVSAACLCTRLGFRVNLV